MKTSPQVSTEIRSSHDVMAQPRLVADWNLNRYIDATVSNVPSEDTDGFDIEFFPIESLIEPVRPTKGVAKAILNQSLVANDYEQSARPRFYTASSEDKYKYWVSPNLSDGAGNITGVAPAVVYSETVAANKIVINVENSWASPVTHYVEITTNGTAWSVVSTNPSINNKGQIIIYYNGTGWSSNKPASLAATKNIRGVRYRVDRLGAGRDGSGQVTTFSVDGNFQSTTGYYSSLALISLGAHIEMDLTDRLISCDDTFDFAETSLLYPIGTITSNVGTVVLWNGDGFLSSGNTASSVHKLLDAGVQMNLEYVYDVGGVKYPVQQFRMFTEIWSGQKTEKVSVSLADGSKFLKEATPNPSMWEGQTVQQIVARVCDSVGFVDYDIDQSDQVTELIVPIFWTSGEETVWEIFDGLAKATQTAIYFDSYGTLKVKSREDAFDKTKLPVWTLRGETSGTELADIISLDQSNEMNPNHVTVIYQNTQWETYSDGTMPALRVVWKPEGETEVLRSSPLRRSITTGDTTFSIPADDATLWPYSGLVNIEGELIRYDAKQYIYYTDNGGTRNVVWISSKDELDKFNKKTEPRYRYMNHYTGHFNITERGVWNSEEKGHSVDAGGYSVRHIVNGTRRVDVYGFKHNPAQSKVTLNTRSNFKDYHDVLLATRGAEVDSGFYSYGAMFNFVKEADSPDQIAGLIIHNNSSDEDGYYIEFRPSDKIDAKTRANRHEVLLYSRKNGKQKRFGNERGVAVALVENVEYDVDVYITTSHVITIWVNGKRIMTDTIPPSWQNARNGKFGMFAKGKTHVQFEYLYAIARDEQPADGADDSSFLDRINGEYVGRQWDREWIFKWRSLTRRQKKKSTKNRRRWNQMFIDDFGPFVHEVREYNAVFENSPVLRSELYLTNDWSAVCPEYTADAFSARFVVANTARTNAVVHGGDTISYAGTDKEVSQALTVIGQSLEILDGEEVVVKNENQMRRRGRIEIDLSSPWIQNKDMASIIAEWISDHWGDGTEEFSVEIFGNTLIELGDVVAVDFPRKHMDATTHKFFVTGVTTNFDRGVKTTLTLRRIV